MLLNISNWAYIGPGAGLTMLGAAVALVFGVLLMIVGLIWYPLKRMLRGIRRAAAADEKQEFAEVGDDLDTSNSSQASGGE